MFLPSPLTGQLVDRLGRRPVIAAGGLTLLAAGLVAALAPPDSMVLLTVALALLGLGWNLGLVGGTALVTDATPAATRRPHTGDRRPRRRAVGRHGRDGQRLRRRGRELRGAVAHRRAAGLPADPRPAGGAD